MLNNDVLRRLRYALDISESAMTEIFRLADYTITADEIAPFIKREEEEGFVFCPDFILTTFLDGLIIQRRGKNDKPGAKKPDRNLPLNNNMILKKIRIAMEYREEEMLEVFALGDMNVSKHELTAFFRKPEHKHFRELGDQFLRNFLVGLTEKIRSSAS